MKHSSIFRFFIFGLIAGTLSACGGSTKENATEADTADSLTTEAESTTEKPKTVTLAPGETPFGFPAVATKAEAGDVVLCPSYKMWTSKLATEDPTKETYLFYHAEMETPGELESEVKFTFDGTQKMPNSMLVRIPKGQKAKVGDVVLTWWQTGSGMQRAIVTEASNPAEPTVRYLDLSWDNPAQDRDSGKGIGQTEYKLKPNSFTVIGPFSQGSTIAAKDGDDWRCVQVIANDGQQVLTLGFAGRMKTYPRKDCKTIPQIVKVQPGDKVQAVFVGNFRPAEVVSVDERLGVVFVKFEHSPKESPVSFGQISKGDL
ncbi:hypothetical protein [Eisenibacter elegans]|jgi:hypothetical protein|uniref:hypothetical protein n=1 Tax=Eisenibacter elegans TaxID=997 RepID=UPI00041ACC26|nr:hypothetical protein [Eisenibacter elegans]